MQDPYLTQAASWQMDLFATNLPISRCKKPMLPIRSSNALYLQWDHCLHLQWDRNISNFIHSLRCVQHIPSYQCTLWKLVNKNSSGLQEIFLSKQIPVELSMKMLLIDNNSNRKWIIWVELWRYVGEKVPKWGLSE